MTSDSRTIGDTPWRTDRWHTSPWNHDASVVASQTFPENLQIHDVTLRDGEQHAGVEFTADEKIRIAEELDGIGVHRIEAGLPAVSPEDEKAVRAIARRGLNAEIYAFSRCMVDDVDRAAQCGVRGVVMEIPSSRHLIELGYRWTVERATELSIEATAFAHQQGLKVTFFPIDATRASMHDYLTLVRSVADQGHIDCLVLVDTFGVLGPHAVEWFTTASREHMGVPLETHFHMDYGLGVANSIIAASAGASVIHTTVGGLGERAGNAPLEETVMALLTLYGIDTGIRTEGLTQLSRLVMSLAKVDQPSNRPVTGTGLFNVESGIIATWVRNVRDGHLTEAFPYLPGLVGQSSPSLVLGKGSGVDSVADVLERLGIKYSSEELVDVLSAVKAASLARKRLLTDEEFVVILNSVRIGAAT